MSSDSDRTIDSDELDELIAKVKKEQESAKREITIPKRSSKLHDLSDSEPEEKLPSPAKKKKLKSTQSVKKDNLDTVKRESIDKKKKLKDLQDTTKDNRPLCQYGSKCYRKNPDHKKEFYHPSADSQNSLLPSSKSPAPKRSTTESQNSSACSNPQFAESCRKFHFYVTRVNGIPSKYNNEISYNIKDLLSFQDGTLVSSAQFNYMFDVAWLIEQYPQKYRNCPITIVHGEQRESKKALERSGASFPNVKFCQAKLDIPFGTHHTKMMFLKYKEGFRLVIHTSNIVPTDWAQKTQGMWISHLLPELKSASVTDGESPTKFKADLLEYLSAYGAPDLEEWCQVIKKHDFSKIRVVLIGSVPGRHVGSRKTSFGHLKLRKVLNLNGPSKDIVQHDWNVIGQFSSIGSLGPNPDQWLCSEFSSSLVTCKDTSMVLKSSSLKLIYPSVENVRKSLEGYPAGGSLPYSIKVAQKQPYLKSFLHQWKSDKIARSEASPHIKTYLRLSPGAKRIAWFLVTSANLSKAAWGALEKQASQLMIRSYELGVLYLPKFFDSEFFYTPGKSGIEEIPFPVPYDILLQPYSPEDEPWIWDIPHTKGPDRFGNMWCPP